MTGKTSETGTTNSNSAPDFEEWWYQAIAACQTTDQVRQLTYHSWVKEACRDAYGAGMRRAYGDTWDTIMRKLS